MVGNVRERWSRERQRPLVDIAAEVMADESQRIGISYTGFCLTSLPHKRLPDEETWEKKGHRVTLWVEPGRMKSRGRVVTYGVPYAPAPHDPALPPNPSGQDGQPRGRARPVHA